MNLYEIKEQYRTLLEKIENGDISEDAIKDTLESVEGDFQDKADNVASYIKSLLCEAVALKEEANNLTVRGKAKEGKAESLRLYLESMMLQIGIKKVETTRNVLVVKKNPASVNVDEGFAVWAETHSEEAFVRVKTAYEPDKKMIKEIINAGNIVPFCRLVESEKLNIK